MGAGAPPRRRLQGGGCRPSVRCSSGAAACALQPHRTGCWGPTRCHRLTGAAGAHTEQLLSGSSVCSILPKIATFERNGQPACHLSACHLSGGSAGMRPLPSKPCPHAQLLGASPQRRALCLGPCPSRWTRAAQGGMASPASARSPSTARAHPWVRVPPTLKWAAGRVGWVARCGGAPSPAHFPSSPGQQWPAPGGVGAGEAGRGVGQVPRAQVFYLPDCDRCCISWAQRHSPGLDGHGLQTQSPRVQGFAGTQDP